MSKVLKGIVLLVTIALAIDAAIKCPCRHISVPFIVAIGVATLYLLHKREKR